MNAVAFGLSTGQLLVRVGLRAQLRDYEDVCLRCDIAMLVPIIFI